MRMPTDLAVCAIAYLVFFFCRPAGAFQEWTWATPANTDHRLIYIPAGPFTMGSDVGQADERPAHTVHVDAFYIDKFEVTVVQFAAFLNARGGAIDAQGFSLIDLDDADTPVVRTAEGFVPRFTELATRPVMEVTWYGARAYCRWAGLRLPTEAEWEKAARGDDGRRYPWGENIDRSMANYGTQQGGRGDAEDGYFVSAPVGRFPAGVSPYGVHDMAGNVWELVADWYAEDYYAQAGTWSNPAGPSDGAFRVIRGGSWASGPERLRTTERGAHVPTTSYILVGFRCAAPTDVKPATGVAPTGWGRVKEGFSSTTRFR